MQAIKQLYKIGFGPSSSHTIAPYRIAQFYKNSFPNCDNYKIRLGGSLALTAKGHGTINILKNALETENIDITTDYDENSSFEGIDIDYKLFNEGEPSINWQNWKKIPAIYHPHEFDYGYVITVHKAQGSEWDKVTVFEEYMKDQSREDFKRWLYTATTRAAKKLIIVRRT